MAKRRERPISRSASLVDKLNLGAEIESTATANDLLPPREDDGVGGELGKRFVEYLKNQLETGRYSPQPAEFVRVPKAGSFTSRPAAALTLTDRIVYEALVRALRPAIAKYLVPDDVLMWPREGRTRKRWLEFEEAPIEDGGKYIVRADVSGFYESIEHSRLAEDLIYATGDAEIVDELVRFLGIVMRMDRGVPQGLLASDALATTFLQKVDSAMVREGLRYWRHGDDIRVSSPSISSAREAIVVFEEELRKRGLLINSAKCVIVPRDDYAKDLRRTEEAFQNIHELLLETRVDELAGDSDALVQAIRDAGFDSQLVWDLFYHERISVAEVIEKLHEFIEPSEVEVAETLFLQAIGAQPDTANPLPREVFHHQIVSALVRLAAGRSPVAIQHSASLIAKFPEKTELTCQYLLAMVATHAALVVAQIENVLNSDVYQTPWQQAWLLRVLGPLTPNAEAVTIMKLKALAQSDSVDWIVRVESLKALASSGALESDVATHAWKRAPMVYRPDVLAAVGVISRAAEWAKRFVTVTTLDPVERVVVSRATSQNKSARPGIVTL